jgi:hypothetical protein
VQKVRLSSRAENQHGYAQIQIAVPHWFITMHLLASTKKSFSAKELQGQSINI